MTGRRRVLLVGDPLNAGILRHHLDLRDLDAECVEYGDAALTALAKQRFVLVLLLSARTRWNASSRPTVWFNGVEVLKRTRAVASTTPVVVMSAFPEVEQESLAHGACAFVPKRVDLRELDRVVTAALGESGRPIGPDAEDGGELDNR